MKTFRVKVGPNGKLPTKANPQAAGLDLYAAGDYPIEPGSVSAIPTDLTVEFEPGYVALLCDRSGLGAKGITTKIPPTLLAEWYKGLADGELQPLAGVIDSDYRGDWRVVLHNTTSATQNVKKGDRIAQLVFLRLEDVNVIAADALPIPAEKLSDTERGAGGFGSTGS